MARTFIRQDNQIRRSDVYDDSIVPSLANYETNPVSIEGDLNSIRSQLQNLLNRNGVSFPAGDWFGDIVAPVTFENGSKRGINEVGQQLHDLERKRVLVKAVSLADVTVPVSIFATGTLTSVSPFSDGTTVSIAGQTYTFRSPFVDAPNNINASGTQAQTHESLRRAINGSGVAGANYGTGTVPNAFVTAADTATTNVITAKKSGTSGNFISTTETGGNISFGALTLLGGAGGDVVVLGVGQLPPNTIAAVGVVTTRGTVVSLPVSTLGVASLNEVVGSNAVSPRNLVDVVDGDNRKPIISDGKTVYGLLQGGPGLADGDTILASGSDRVQVTFVRINASGDGLETISGADTGGIKVNLCFSERKALEDLTEQDFLRGAVTDIPSSSTVTRQAGYLNQGTSPVDLTTNATLDLEGTGLVWAIRDDLEASLFRIVEGSAGGTSAIQLTADVDLFDVNAIDNDFLNGIKVDTGSAGTTINIGVTANQIDGGGVLRISSGAASDLSLAGGLELNLSDSYRVGSTWSLVDGIPLASASSDWTSFETNFGETSLLAAINQSYASSNTTKFFSNVTVDANADTDVGGVGGGTNIDTQLPNMSGGNFLVDYDVYLNGNLLRPGANSASNNDYYPGTSLAGGQLRFEFRVKTNDVLCVVARA